MYCSDAQSGLHVNIFTYLKYDWDIGFSWTLYFYPCFIIKEKKYIGDNIVQASENITVIVYLELSSKYNIIKNIKMFTFSLVFWIWKHYHIYISQNFYNSLVINLIRKYCIREHKFFVFMSVAIFYLSVFFFCRQWGGTFQGKVKIVAKEFMHWQVGFVLSMVKDKYARNFPFVLMKILCITYKFSPILCHN